MEGNDDIESGKGEDNDNECSECKGMGNAEGKITGSREGGNRMVRCVSTIMTVTRW